MSTPEDLVIETSERVVQRLEQQNAAHQPPWDGFGGLLKVCDDPELREHGIIRAVAPKLNREASMGSAAVEQQQQQQEQQQQEQQQQEQQQQQQQHAGPGVSAPLPNPQPLPPPPPPPQQQQDPAWSQQRLLQLYQQYHQHMASLGDAASNAPAPPLHQTPPLPTRPPASAPSTILNPAPDSGSFQAAAPSAPQVGSAPSTSPQPRAAAPSYANSGGAGVGSASTSGRALAPKPVSGRAADAPVGRTAPRSSGAVAQETPEDLRDLYNSPSVAAARKEAGLPDYLPPDDTSWVQALPSPPAAPKPRPPGSKK